MSKSKGPKFRSGFEKKVYEGAIEHGHTLEHEPRDAILRYNTPSTYLPDFRTRSGILIESKGYFDGRSRAKMLRVKKQNRDSDIRIVFQRANNKIGKSPSSLTYWQWAEKHGFAWSEGNIPKDWLDE